MKKIKTTVYYAIINNRHGTEIEMAATNDELDSKIAAYCREYWNDDGPGDKLSMEGLTDAEIIEEYFWGDFAALDEDCTRCAEFDLTVNVEEVVE